MKTVLGAASAMALLLSTQTAAAHDSKPEVEETYEFSGFESVTIEGVYHIDVQVGQSFSVKASGSERDMAKADIYVEDGALVLGRKYNKGSKKTYNNNKGVDMVITMPSLTGMDVAGVVSGNVRAIDADAFSVQFAGVGKLDLAGTCKHLEIDLAGVGELDASDLKCEDVNVDLAGMGEVSVYASERVDANAAGMGQIEVYGKPDIVQKSSTFMAKVRIR